MEIPHLIVWKETAPHEIACSPSSSLFISPISKFEDKVIKGMYLSTKKEYEGLTYHESNLLGALYHHEVVLNGNGKKLYQFCHQLTYKHGCKGKIGGEKIGEMKTKTLPFKCD